MLIAVTHGVGCASFLFVILLMLLNRKPEGVGLFAVCVFFVTALWAGMEAVQHPSLMGWAHALGSVKNWIWLQFIATILIIARAQTEGGSRVVYRYLIPLLGLIAVVNDLRFVAVIANPIAFDASQILARIALATAGILMVENLYRNTIASRRWHIFPFCAAAGLLFTYDLFVFVDAVVEGGIDATLLAGRGLMLVLVSPLLVLTMARNEEWRVDVHVSRRVVFHTATLTAGGIFLIVAAGVASLFGRISNEWGPVLVVFFFCGALVVLVSVFGMGSMRTRVWRLIAENFFSHRYDYREEWMRLVDTLSEANSPDSLEQRVIRAIADVVESPGGVLWLEDESGDYKIATTRNFDIDEAAIEKSESAFIAAFENGENVLDLRQKTSPGLPPSDRPKWLQGASSPFLAVPLMEKEHLLGFIVLKNSNQPITLNWESIALLRAIGRQVASYLSQERATRLLSEAQAIASYNQRFAFAIHDVKNLASQLKMLVSNIQKFGDDPEFRRDMIVTLNNSVTRLDNLLTRLRSGVMELEKNELVDPVQAVEDVISSLAQGNVKLQSNGLGPDVRVWIGPADMRSMLTHLVTNALEVSPSGETVDVRLLLASGDVLIEIEDNGPGMDQAFIRDQLFKPFQTTKSRGHGIGTYQSREIARGAGGDIVAISSAARGTTIRITLPCAGDRALSGEQGALSA